jgi:hypothetical protein
VFLFLLFVPSLGLAGVARMHAGYDGHLVAVHELTVAGAPLWGADWTGGVGKATDQWGEAMAAAARDGDAVRAALSGFGALHASIDASAAVHDTVANIRRRFRDRGLRLGGDEEEA